jgi:hypothetical protein
VVDRQLDHRLRLSTTIDGLQPQAGSYAVGAIRRKQVGEALPHERVLLL